MLPLPSQSFAAIIPKSRWINRMIRLWQRCRRENIKSPKEIHCDRYKSTAWHVLASLVLVTLPFLKTWSQQHPLRNTNMLCLFRSLWCHPHPYGMHANNMPWDVIPTHQGLRFVTALPMHFDVIILCFLLWCCCDTFDPPTIWVQFQCHFKFYGGTTFLPWFCAFS